MLQRAATILILLASTLSVVAQAHLVPHGPQDRGGGTLAGCNPTLVVDFNAHILGELEYHFDPLVEMGENLFLGSIWSHLSSSFGQTWQDTLILQFPATGEYPVCLTVNAFDLLAQAPCSTTTCRLIDIVPDSLCLALEVDFGLAQLDGQTVTFGNLSDYPGGPVQYLWGIDDGSQSTEPEPTFSFNGPGPHKVCLTVSTISPPFCSRSLCKWLYFGPGNVDCDVLAQQGFLLVQQDNLVGVLDTSVTSGMDNSIGWDFGDGAQAQGRVAVHAYSDAGWYDLCSTLSLWGPLLGDTCQRTLCTTVEYLPAVGMNESGPTALLHAWPVPVRDVLHVAGIGGEASLVLVDGLGRSVINVEVTEMGTHVMDLAEVPPGTYLLRVVQQDRQRSLRVVKQE